MRSGVEELGEGLGESGHCRVAEYTCRRACLVGEAPFVVGVDDSARSVGLVDEVQAKPCLP